MNYGERFNTTAERLLKIEESMKKPRAYVRTDRCGRVSSVLHGSPGHRAAELFGEKLEPLWGIEELFYYLKGLSGGAEVLKRRVNESVNESFFT